jgi:O-antigen ligase/tetratricopeptide (TPR) repeat protein
LLFSNHTVEAFEYPKSVALWVTALLLVTMGLCLGAREWLSRGTSATLAMLPRALRSIGCDPLAVGVILFVLSASMSTVASISPHSSFYGSNPSYSGFLTLSSYAVIFFGTRHFYPSADDGRHLLTAVVGGAAVVSIYALTQALGLDPVPWDSTTISTYGAFQRPAATLGHPNSLATFLVMGLPITAYFAFRAVAGRRWVFLSLLALAGVFSCVAIVATLSRGAWLAFGVTLAVFLLGSFRSLRLRTATGVVLALLVIAAVGLTYAALASSTNLSDRLVDRLLGWSNPANRYSIWATALAIFREYPLTGCGIDTFQLAFAPKQSADYWLTEWGVTPNHAHNELLHVLATQGVLGAAALALLLFGVGRAIVRGWRQTDLESRTLTVAVTAGLGGFFVQSLFSSNGSGCVTLFVVFAALLSRSATNPSLHYQGTSRKRERRTPRRSRFRLVMQWVLVYGGIGTGSALLAFFGILRPLQANVACRTGDTLLDAAPRQALTYYESAAASDPSTDLYWLKLGTAAQLAAEQADIPDERRELLLRARTAFEQALRLVPQNPHHHANLAKLLIELTPSGLSQSAEVFEHFDDAIAQYPVNAYFYREAAAAAFRLGCPARARSYIERGLALYPKYCLLNVQAGYTALIENRPADAVPFFRQALAVYHRDLDRSSRLSVMVTLATTLLKLQRPGEALDVCQVLVREEPRWVPGLLVHANTLEMLGNRASAAGDYRAILTECPNHSAAQEGLRRCGAALQDLTE